MYKTVPLTVHTLEEFMQSLRVAKDSTNYSKRSIDLCRVRVNIYEKLQTGEMFGVLIKHKDKVVGHHLLALTEDILTCENFIDSLSIFVHKEYRGTRVMQLMIDKVKAFYHTTKDSLKLSGIVDGVSSGIDIDKTLGMYNKLGYELQAVRCVYVGSK